MKAISGRTDISQKQFNTIQGAINDALKSKDNVNIKFTFGN